MISLPALGSTDKSAVAHAHAKKTPVTWAGALSKPFWTLRGEPLNKFTTMIYFKDYKKRYSCVTEITVISELTKNNSSSKYVCIVK